ncbi:MAG TPA: PA0069 family radical SAM protein [Leeuwenhoekiella sp.]|nr:PA0069 family radical SAM protein [Leeuwenhoekiella sp.]
MSNSEHIKGRGAQKHVTNRFSEHSHEVRDDFLNYCEKEGDDPENNRTLFLETFPKTIVNKVESPDVGMGYSLNPYQGCEHGCVYCYARNSHEYWGYDAGLDFESRILVKKNAVELLETFLAKKNWKAHPIVLSGNTDCYQPVEKKLEITRQLLQVFQKYRHPVGIITKNALVTRDLDILKDLAKDNLVHVNISVTSLEEKTRQLLEPRTATIKKRLEAVRQLSDAGIPVRVMAAPIIPGINAHEILPLIKKSAEYGAKSVGYTVVRLNGAIAGIFEDWLRKALPDRADKVLHQIAECHDGKLNDSQFGRRMRGSGEFAAQIKAQVELGRKRFLPNQQIEPLNCELFEQFRPGQLSLF